MGDSGKNRQRGIGFNQLMFSVSVALVIGIGAYAWAAARRAPPPANHFLIKMTDYAFSPSHMVWHVGQKITITLVNDSRAHPGKAHEWMLGRGPKVDSTVFGPRQAEGFRTPFFKGVTIHIDRGHGLLMMAAGPSRFVGLSPKKVLSKKAKGGMEMGKMAGFMPLLSPPTAKAKPWATPGKGVEASQVTSVLVKAPHESNSGGRVTFTFTVPDKPGVWTYGCFQQSGQHFLNGMRGTVDIKAS